MIERAISSCETSSGAFVILKNALLNLGNSLLHSCVERVLTRSGLLGLAQSITNLTIEASLSGIFLPRLVFNRELLDRGEQDVFFVLLQFLLLLIEDCLDAVTLQADSVLDLSENALLVLIDLLAL